MQMLSFALSGVLMIGLLVALLVGVRRWSARTVRRRLAERSGPLSAWGSYHGWVFEPGPRTDVPRMFGTDKPFHTGEVLGFRQHLARLLLHGRVRTQPAMAFELRTRVVAGSRPSIELNAVVSVRLTLVAPVLAVTPKFWPRQLDESTPLVQRFFAGYDVRAADPAFRARVLTPGLMAWFVAQLGSAYPPAVRLAGTTLLCWQTGQITPAWLDRILPVLSGIVDSL